MLFAGFFEFFFEFFMRTISRILSLISFFCCSTALAENLDGLFPTKTVYFGVNMGGGYTTWKYLVDTADPPDTAVKETTPSGVREGGPSWGVVFGYDLARNFAVELQYMRFADSHITFDPDAALAYNLSDGTAPATILSKTEAYSLSGKL